MHIIGIVNYSFLLYIIKNIILVINNRKQRLCYKLEEKCFFLYILHHLYIDDIIYLNKTFSPKFIT